MRTFTLQLQDSVHGERIEGVSVFVGEDSSGSFGVLAGHARLLAILAFGLARFRVGREPWCYLAVPGAVLHFVDNQMFVGARRYFVHHDYAEVAEALSRELLAEEQELSRLKNSLRQLEDEMLKRFWRMGREGLHF